MARTLRASAAVRQSKAIDPEPCNLATNVDTALALLRRCIHDTGWTLDALGAEMDLDKSLISRVLNGERPMTLRFLVALPDDVEALFEQRRAESFGLIVVAPVSGEQAVKNFISGAFGLLAPKLPRKADRMAKAALEPETEG